MRILRANLTFANAVALIALFIALGGSAYAATQVPGDSVGTKQLKREAVTPGKLSSKAKAALAGPAGPTGPSGPQGDRGPRGQEGARGAAGTTGNEPVVIDTNANATAFAADSPVPVTGTTSWTAAPGELGLLTGRFTASLAGAPGSEEGCSANVVILDNGKQVSRVSGGRFQETFAASSGTLDPVAIAVAEPGTHTITATSYGEECRSGSEISVHVVVVPLGQ
jgi:hypothetical protein